MIRMVTLIQQAAGLLTIPACLVSSLALGSEISLVKGLYESQENRAGGDKVLETTVLGGGARYLAPWEDPMTLFVQGLFEMRSYSGENPKPSDSTSIQIGGGIRYYGQKWSESFHPFLQASASLSALTSAEKSQANSYTETKENGIQYDGAFGFRMKFDQDFFVDLELPLFKSGLSFARKVETTTRDATGNETKTETEEKHFDFYGSSYAGISEMTVSVGMHL